MKTGARRGGNDVFFIIHFRCFENHQFTRRYFGRDQTKTSRASALFEPSLKPLWADYSALSYFVPILQVGFNPLLDYIMSTTLILLIIAAADRLTKNWNQRKILFAVLIVLTGFIVSGISTESLSFFLLTGLIKGFVYLLAYIVVFRYNLSLIPLATGSMAILEIS